MNRIEARQRQRRRGVGGRKEGEGKGRGRTAYHTLPPPGGNHMLPGFMSTPTSERGDDPRGKPLSPPVLSHPRIQTTRASFSPRFSSISFFPLSAPFSRGSTNARSFCLARLWDASRYASRCLRRFSCPQGFFVPRR